MSTRRDKYIELKTEAATALYELEFSRAVQRHITVGGRKMLKRNTTYRRQLSKIKDENKRPLVG